MKNLTVKTKRKRKHLNSKMEDSEMDGLDALMAEELDEDKKIDEEPGSESGSDAEDDGNDSDRELQVALQEGLLKSDALNYVVEKKRPMINKVEEMKEKLKSFTKNLPWIESLSVDVKADTASAKVDDDFQRELIFYKQAEKAARIAVDRLLKMKVKVFRPPDYYAEMAKTDDHMQKVRKRLLDLKEGKERQETIRRIREEKKFAVKVQKDAIEKRQTEKRKLMEAVKKHRKGMKAELDQMLSNAKKLQEENLENGFSSGEKGRGNKLVHRLNRSARDKKFGFGGQKKRSKRNTKESFNDIGISKIKAKGYSQRKKFPVRR